MPWPDYIIECLSAKALRSYQGTRFPYASFRQRLPFIFDGYTHIANALIERFRLCENRCARLVAG
jgi:hypothetical protein